MERIVRTIYQIKTRIGCEISFPKRRFASLSERQHTLPHFTPAAPRHNLIGKLLPTISFRLYNAKSTHDPKQLQCFPINTEHQTNKHSLLLLDRITTIALFYMFRFLMRKNRSVTKRASKLRNCFKYCI